ncbi:phosphotyrosine protein phosphatase I superfamily [Hyaloraphidium curvatum]|nr:phosphotyrosine protein phosphatase I superfamily [Hyaloraphidium curvatum]
MGDPPIKVLFICLGNICRSPMCEAVFADMVRKRGLSDRIKVDSAGTAGYHIGSSPDPRSAETCRRHGVPVDHRARQLKPRDFEEFDYILAMDTENVSNARRIAPKEAKAKLDLFGKYGDVGIVEDPYYGGPEGFEINFKQVTKASEAFLEHLKKNHGL